MTEQLSKSQMLVLKLLQIHWLHLYFLQRLPNQCSKRANMIFRFRVQFLVHNPARHKPTSEKEMLSSSQSFTMLLKFFMIISGLLVSMGT